MEPNQTINNGLWNKEINVSDFVSKNITPYTGDASFLQGPTERTKHIWDLCLKALASGCADGVLARPAVQTFARQDDMNRKGEARTVNVVCDCSVPPAHRNRLSNKRSGCQNTGGCQAAKTSAGNCFETEEGYGDEFFTGNE